MFNPSTDDWTGMETTVIGLMKSIHEDTPFVCHEHLPHDEKGDWYLDPKRPETMELCSGYAAVMGDPESKKAMFAALTRTGSMQKVLGATLQRRAELLESDHTPAGTTTARSR